MLENQKSFFDTDDQQFSLQVLALSLADSQKFIMSSAEGSLFIVTLIPESPIVKLLISLQNGLSSFLGSGTHTQYSSLIQPSLHGLSNKDLR